MSDRAGPASEPARDEGADFGGGVDRERLDDIRERLQLHLRARFDGGFRVGRLDQLAHGRVVADVLDKDGRTVAHVEIDPHRIEPIRLG